MALEIYRDDAMQNLIKQTEKFNSIGATTLALTTLLGSEVEAVYRYVTGSYTKLTTPTDYSIVGNDVILTSSIQVGQHVIIMPIDNLDIVFTGTESSIRTQTKKLVFNKTGAFIYDGLRLYSEDFTTPPYEYTETIINDGFMAVSLDGLNLYDKNGLLMSDSNAVGLQLFSTNLTPDITYGYPAVALVVNGLYLGNIRANDTSVIALPLGTILPTPNYTIDIIELYSTGNLTFAADSNGTIPADEAFKALYIVPTLTTLAPTQKVWLREFATIPSVAIEMPNMPFKLIGQEYPE